ncbi:2OG-Fe(II) oxygenase [Pseudomarimonas salicorniae]|uniref:2OG-Fe(II) oxygenase n=1 Tax=Pseudomarimonas salicorniae TaxID=2933270 RepID=A0ABT0GJX3_9GAMM|nr:2OG-Fe(II) oxygenase [Lysobacter sp. CAU 1642]MCK7594315.1 2OG-Fe(II) oxygenase [Lysobacter sp. CAU 1642]
MLSSDDLDLLVTRGFVVVEGLLPDYLLTALVADCQALDADDALRPAAVGRGEGRTRDASLRGDAIRWIDPHPEVPVRGEFLARLDALRIELNRQLMLGLDHFEAHYAIYPPGAGYVRHVDRFRDDDARTVSFAAYLNPDWSEDDGGALRLYLPGGEVDIVPRLGTCALFLSASIEHEVLTTQRPRMSIAGWFRRRPLLPLKVVPG